MDLCNIQTIKQLMAEHGIAPRKDFGQNFLINPKIPQRIAESCCENPDSVILEIGPGVGALTRELALRYRRVVALEIDRGLLPVLEKTLVGLDNVTVIGKDVMAVDLPALLEKEAGGLPVSVCANLPYYITTPILMKLLECGVPFDYITVMVQREVADRLCARPGTADYGAITATLGYYGSVEKLFEVSAGNFLPAPKVSSAVIRIRRYMSPPFSLREPDLFFRLIKAAFGQRRKTLQNAVAPLFPNLTKGQIGEVLVSLGHRPDVRGERLSSKAFAELADALSLLEHPG